LVGEFFGVSWDRHAPAVHAHVATSAAKTASRRVCLVKT